MITAHLALRHAAANASARSAARSSIAAIARIAACTGSVETDIEIMKADLLDALRNATRELLESFATT